MKISIPADNRACGVRLNEHRLPLLTETGNGRILFDPEDGKAGGVSHG